MRNLIFMLALLMFSRQAMAHGIAPQNDEEILDTFFDVGCVAFDVIQIATTGTGWAALAADLACTAVPGATGGGCAVRTAQLATAGATKVSFTTKVVTSAITLTAKAKSLCAVGKLPKIALTKLQLDEIYQHVLMDHSVVSESGKTLFKNVTNTKHMDEVFQTMGQRINDGYAKMSVDVVNNDFAYTMYVDMGKAIGTKGEQWIAFFYMPGSKGFVGSCFPVSTGKVMNRLPEIGHNFF